MNVATCQIQQGLFLETKRCSLVNRTGAALSKGDIAAVNMDFVNTTYDELAPGTNYVYGNCVAVTTENATRILVVCESDSIASGAEGIFIVESPDCIVKMNGANAGEFLTGTNAQVYGTPLTLTEILALTTQAGIVGIALEGTTGAQAKRAMFNGFAFKSLCGGDT